MHQSYFYNRIYEVKYISKELQMMETRKFRECSFSDEKEIILKVSGSEKDKKHLTYDEFEKLPEMCP